MEEIPAYLFVYGTLLNDQNEFGAYLKHNCRFFKNGRFKGKLYDIGKYPGAVFEPAIGTFVHGAVFIINRPTEILKVLDDYEGFGTGYPQPNEYLRELVDIETGGEYIKCWVYLYNWPVNNAAQIPLGNYVVFKGPK